MAITTVTTCGRAAKRMAKGRGLSDVSGKIVLSTTSQFPASGIERYFRRCDNIVLNDTSGYNIKFLKSSVKNYSVIETFLCSAAPGSTSRNNRYPMAASNSTTFTAFGV